MKILNIITQNHKKIKRKYLERMVDKKTEAMKIARKYDFNYWDGKRRYGYGGYKYIEGYWTPVAKKLIKKFSLTNKSSILDIGCGKGFLLYEIKKILNGINVEGIDISTYSIKKSKNEIKKYLKVSDATKFIFRKKYDLILSINTLHNLEIDQLSKVITKIKKNSKNSYIVVEGYRNINELFNLQCWALTANTFFSKTEWIWFLKRLKYKGHLEIIYFE